jgi:hypothetical protein
VLWVPLLLNLKEGGGRPSKVLGGLQASSLKAQMADTGHQTLRDCLRAVFFVMLAARRGLARRGWARHGVARAVISVKLITVGFAMAIVIMRRGAAGLGLARRGWVGQGLYSELLLMRVAVR